eukprot:TRINITY_DN20922_c0_g1_i1.p2 TRINITY_DN20922_c0_g1~~TRINITY_DN20922_c0_g1_i1.p2  ORF type:complete len:118 (-),score=19.39 TRINITY_DN20922_c0_g1_i1:158-511(-)
MCIRDRYLLYGPMLLVTCMYFLFNIKEYSFACRMPGYRKEYGYKTHIIVSILAFVSVLVTFLWCVKKLIKRLSQTLRNDQSCFTKVINSFICKSENSRPADEDELQRINVDVERNQL